RATRRSPASSASPPTGSTACSSSPSAVISAWCSWPWSDFCWCWRYGCDRKSPRAGRADAAGAVAGAAADRPSAQGEGAPAAPPRPAAAAALSRPAAPHPQGGGGGGECLLAVPRRALPHLRRHLGGRGLGADLCDRPPVQLVGGPDRDRGAARQRTVLP